MLLVFVYSALDISCVEYFMCLVTAGLLKEFLIELEHCGVILRFAVGEEVLIGIVKNGSTNGLEVDFGFCLCALNGLTAAVYTAAGTAHNFDKVNFDFAALDLIKKFLGVLCAACNRNSYSRGPRACTLRT